MWNYEGPCFRVSATAPHWRLWKTYARMTPTFLVAAWFSICHKSTHKHTHTHTHENTKTQMLTKKIQQSKYETCWAFCDACTAGIPVGYAPRLLSPWGVDIRPLKFLWLSPDSSPDAHREDERYAVYPAQPAKSERKSRQRLTGSAQR